ncbi:MAG: glycoside hydrolase family 2 TIM barrel-domain containing protein, partial [Flavobacteriaceae bacterium]
MKITRLIFSILTTTLMGLLVGCNPATEKVTIKGRQIRVNDAPYFIKGVCYNPVPKGSEKRDFTTLKTDLNLMVEAGINTLRVYSPIEEKSVLDQIEAAGIKVIISIGYNQQGYYDLNTKSYINYVKKYKDHNAILLWELGNEYNYHPEWFDGDIKKWYAIVNQAAKAIHQIDGNHPVSTAHGELPDSLAFSMCTDLDLWGLNVYRWDNPHALFEQWEELSDKPLYFSEAGSDSYMTTDRDDFTQGENQKAQSVANSKIVDAVFQNAHLISGLTLF